MTISLVTYSFLRVKEFLNYSMGQVMKASQGKANPAQANAILKRKLG